MKVSKNQLVWARFHFAGLAASIDCSMQSSGLSGLASRSLAALTRRNLSSIVGSD